MNNFDNILQKASSSNKVIFSIIGSHAKEGVDEIFARKIKDIDKMGYTFWLHKSWKARPDKIQRFCENNPLFVLFLNSSIKNGARPTTGNKSATCFSHDNIGWTSKIVSRIPLPPYSAVRYSEPLW